MVSIPVAGTKTTHENLSPHTVLRFFLLNMGRGLDKEKWLRGRIIMLSASFYLKIRYRFLK